MITTFLHSGFAVNDLEAAIELYRSLSFSVVNRFENPEPKALVAQLKSIDNATDIELWQFIDATHPHVKYIRQHLAVISDDLENDIKKLEKKGCKLVIPITKGITLTYAFIRDHSGNYIEIVKQSNGTKQEKTNIDKVKIFTDGGSRGNPGPSAGGYVIMDIEDRIIVQKGIYLGITTNNQAEYRALKVALEDAIAHSAKKADVYMDSLLIVNQLNGVYKIKNQDLYPIYMDIKKLIDNFQDVSFTHVPRALNKIADSEVNKALDEAAVNL